MFQYNNLDSSLHKENFVSYGKDPVGLAVLYTACQEEGEKVVQSRIAAAGILASLPLGIRRSHPLGYDLNVEYYGELTARYTLEKFTSSGVAA